MRTRHYGLLIAIGFVLAAFHPAAQAGMIVFNGPQDANGNTCTVGAPHCVIGDPMVFRMFSVSLTSPAPGTAMWEVNIQTNYGTPLPGTNEVIPAYPDQGAMFAMCDFLFEWNGVDYGIVLHAHDGYTPGDLYQVSGFQTSGAVMMAQGQMSPRPELPSLINAGGTQVGTGTLKAFANPGADGVSAALYSVVVDFTAPADFLSTGDFTIHACSYVCDNGYITGTGHIPAVPEPSTTLMVGAGLAGLAALRRRRGSRA